jgi:hypothetical protein
MQIRLVFVPVLSVLVSGFLVGCGGDQPAPVSSTGTGTTPSAPTAPTAPDGSPAAAPTFSGAPSFSAPTVGSSSGTPVSSAETPDAVVKQFLAAIEKNEYERIWDLLPKSYQTQINELFQEFGEEVDAELWDKSFNMMNRYVSTMLAKEEMVYQTPEMQEQLNTLKSSAAMMGAGTVDWLTVEKLRRLSDPANKISILFINSEFSSTQKLKSFDGRVFFAKTISPVAENLHKLVELIVEEASQVEELKSNVQVQMFLQQADIGKFFDGINVSVKTQQEESAVVVIKAMGTPTEFSMVKVEGKWIPQSLAGMFSLSMGMAKAQIPMMAQQVNMMKDRILPALDEVEPLIAAVQKAKTQEEFNVAYTEMNSQAPQIVANSLGMPGLSAMLGAGAVKVSPVTIEVNSDISDAQLGELIKQLEGLTDVPDKAISLPRRSGTNLTIEMTPVINAQKFADSITFTKSVEYDATRRTIVLELEPPTEPETTESAEPEKP